MFLRGARFGAERQHDTGNQAAAFNAVGKGDVTLFAFDNGFDDRQPDAAAFGVLSGSTKEPVEHARMQMRRNAGTGIGNFNDGRVRRSFDADVDAALLRRVANGIVEQVAQQDAEIFGYAVQADRVVASQAKVDVAVVGQRHDVGEE